MTGAVFWVAGRLRFEERGVPDGRVDMVEGERARGRRHLG